MNDKPAGKLAKISPAALANTDVYVFRESTGELMVEMKHAEAKIQFNIIYIMRISGRPGTVAPHRNPAVLRLQGKFPIPATELRSR